MYRRHFGNFENWKINTWVLFRTGHENSIHQRKSYIIIDRYSWSPSVIKQFMQECNVAFNVLKISCSHISYLQCRAVRIVYHEKVKLSTCCRRHKGTVSQFLASRLAHVWARTSPVTWSSATWAWSCCVIGVGRRSPSQGYRSRSSCGCYWAAAVARPSSSRCNRTGTSELGDGHRLDCLPLAERNQPTVQGITVPICCH